MARYGLIVDLNTCTGCMTCVLACKQENLTRPGVQWNRILEIENAALDHITYVRHACMQCDDPPCLDACQSKAITKRADGIVLIDQKKCVGCGGCVDSCPYGVPRLNTDQQYFPGETLPFEKNAAAFRVQLSGKSSKCTFCAHRIDQGKSPVCVEACPSKALIFGDLDDPQSGIRKKLWQSNQLLADQGTHPKVSYIARKSMLKSSEQRITDTK
ncbi:MAG: 4Fe-4S dicluster domain-containing protein [Desulfobacteraceae bacterium]|nr:MAG: 4Fe-4S dicluster domain-containing protein [Desulfobacteraceae bacterium]